MASSHALPWLPDTLNTVSHVEPQPGATSAFRVPIALPSMWYQKLQLASLIPPRPMQSLSRMAVLLGYPVPLVDDSVYR